MDTGSIAIKHATTKKMRSALAAEVKKGMRHVEAKLKSKMKDLEREALDTAFKAPKTAEAEGTAEAKGGRHKPSREAYEDEPNLRMVRDARAIFR